MKQKNMNWITPYLVVIDVQKSVDFYCQAFRKTNVSECAKFRI